MKPIFTHAPKAARPEPALARLQLPRELRGGNHLTLALKNSTSLREMKYDFAKAQALAEREGYITFNLVYAETAPLFHARNPFPEGGVYEDPATGAAAAALAGYLRDIDWPHGGAITIRQGEDMGVPSRLMAEITPERGASIRVTGDARDICEPQEIEV